MPDTTTISPTTRRLVDGMVDRAFGPGGPRVTGLTDVNRGRGVFSIVVRAELDGPRPDGPAHNGSESDDQAPTGPGQAPPTVVAKLAIDGPNGQAARRAGAYRREALAYRELLHGVDVDVPRCHLIEDDDDDGARFLLDDLGGLRAVDQLDGLGIDDAVAVGEALGRLHRHWADEPRLLDLPVRRSTVAGLPPDDLTRGVDQARGRWTGRIGPEPAEVFAGLVSVRGALVDRFSAEGPMTLCHGDPRADNLVFRPDGRAVLFDWQQMAVQFGEADLAWLAATSLDPAVRRSVERDLVAGYGGDFDRYRLGFALPGLAVLLLAQRRLLTERERRFVATSLERIATALDDLDVASLAG